jgi:ribose transport system substrate-binding protein
MAIMKLATGLVLGIVGAGCVALAGCGGKKDGEGGLKGKKFGKFVILDEVQTDGGDRSLAKKNAENTLVKYPEVEAMVGLWAYNAPQCIEALKDADKLGKVKVFSFDEDPVTLDAIGNGTCEGTIVQDPYMFGYESMRYLKEMVVDGKKLDLPENKNISIPVRTIVKDNVAEFRTKMEANLAAGAAGKAAPKQAGAPKFAFITNVADPFWSHAEAGCYAAEKDFGIAVEFQMNSDANIAGQKKIVENIINKGECKGIAISVLDPANQTEMINETAAKLPLITHDSDAPDSDRLFYLGTKNYEAGRELGKLIKKAMPDGGNLMLYVGKIDQQNSKERRDGLLDELEGKPAQ